MTRRLALPVCLLALILSACGTYQIRRISTVDAASERTIPAQSTFLWISRDGNGRLHMEELTLPDPSEAWSIQAPGKRKRCPFCNFPDVELDASGRLSGVSSNRWGELDAITQARTSGDCRELDDGIRPGLYKICLGTGSQTLQVQEVFLAREPIPDGSRVRVEHRTRPDLPEVVEQIVVHVPGVTANRLLDELDVQVMSGEKDFVRKTRADFGVIVIDLVPYRTFKHLTTTLWPPSGQTAPGWPVRSDFPRIEDEATWRPSAQVEFLPTDPPQVVVSYDRRGGSPVDPTETSVIVHTYTDEGVIVSNLAPQNTKPLNSDRPDVVVWPTKRDAQGYLALVTPKNYTGLQGATVFKGYRNSARQAGEPPSFSPKDVRVIDIGYQEITQKLSLTLTNTGCLNLENSALSEMNQEAWKDIDCDSPENDDRVHCTAIRNNGVEGFRFPCAEKPECALEDPCLEIFVEVPVTPSTDS